MGLERRKKRENVIIVSKIKIKASKQKPCFPVSRIAGSEDIFVIYAL